MFHTLSLSSLFFLTAVEFANGDDFQLETDITGGDTADISGWGKFSLVIGTLHRTENGAFYPIHSCGASFIQRYPPALALTAAHCVKPIKGPGGGWTDPRNPNKYWAFRGWTGPKDDVQFTSGHFRAYRIEKIYFPEVWRESNQPVFGDIAVLQLDFGDDGRWYFNIPLSTPVISKQLVEGTSHNPDHPLRSFKEEITGWGMDRNTNQFALTVKKGTVYHIPKDKCNVFVNGLKEYFKRGASGWEAAANQLLHDFRTKTDKKDLIPRLSSYLVNLYRMRQLKHYVFDDERCAMDIKEGKTGNCYGDSGGPLVFHNPSVTTNDIFTLMGVTSSSIAGDCSPHMPVMYSNLEYYSDWIKSIHACIMVEKMDEWETEIKNDPTGQGDKNYWKRQSEFWNNKGRKHGRVPGMVRRTLRNRYTQFAFKKFYVGYMRKWKLTMQAWCNKRTEIEGVFSDANREGWGELTHTSDRVDLPGFFPAMVEYSEWLKEHRYEKYNRAWGRPYIISTGKRHMTNPKSIAVTVEDNLSVSMDMWRGGLRNARLFYIPGILKVSFVSFRVEIRVGPAMTLVCQHLMPWVNGWHLQISLSWLKNKIVYIVNGTEQTACSKEIPWRAQTKEVYDKTLYWGDSVTHVESTYATNIEYRTWTDPPVCCSTYNIPGKCIPKC